MKLREIYAEGKFGLSFEVFPPKTEKGMEGLRQTLQVLADFEPGFISCTYGAGGSTRDRSLQIVEEIVRDFHMTATAHLTCVGSTVAELRSWIREAASVGVENIMALRGDPPAGQDHFVAVEGGLRYANELVSLLQAEFPDLGIGVAGYPEVHQEAPNAEVDLENLKRKVDAGADAVITQLFYDNDDYYRFRDRCEAAGIGVPIVPGLLPILSLQQIKRITGLCRAKLPPALVSRLEACGEDADAMAAVGVDQARAQTEGLLTQGIPGLHYYVLNRADAVQQIMQSVEALMPRVDKG